MIKKTILILLPFIIPSTSYSAINDSDFKMLLEKCVPSGYHYIITKIVKRESSFRPFVIETNHEAPRVKKQPSSKAEAINLARELKSQGINFDVGYGGINSQHFEEGRFFNKMGYSVEDAIDPCTNLKMSAAIFEEAYNRTQNPIKALSIYNTGNSTDGIKNGYVALVLGL
jgi:type IV secretion system protein VirB1